MSILPPYFSDRILFRIRFMTRIKPLRYFWNFVSVCVFVMVLALVYNVSKPVYFILPAKTVISVGCIKMNYSSFMSIILINLTQAILDSFGAGPTRPRFPTYSTDRSLSATRFNYTTSYFTIYLQIVHIFTNTQQCCWYYDVLDKTGGRGGG